MKRLCWWLTDLVSKTLESHEREAVQGDLPESGETGTQALLDVLGLTFRRQSALWMNWPPWLCCGPVTATWCTALLDLKARRRRERYLSLALPVQLGTRFLKQSGAPS